jgi:hypothetical protein
MRVKIALLALIVLALAGCQGPQAITDAALRDTIFSIENRANGAAVMWMTHDDVGTYCTLDKGLAQKAYEIMTSGKDALVKYRTLNANDKENGALGGMFQGACNTERSTNTNYLVTDIQLAPDKAATPTSK